MQYQQIQRARSARKPKLRKEAGSGALHNIPPTVLAPELPNLRPSGTFDFEVDGLDYCATVSRFDRARVVPLDPNASALVIETAITDNAPPFNQPWPPTGLGDGWHAVDKFSTRQRTFWRRIRLEYARPSPRARPVHR
jgi:hypothetical protein